MLALSVLHQAGFRKPPFLSGSGHSLSTPGRFLTKGEFWSVLVAVWAGLVRNGPAVMKATGQPFGLAVAPRFLSGEHPLTPHTFQLPGNEPCICTVGCVSGDRTCCAHLWVLWDKVSTSPLR